MFRRTLSLALSAALLGSLGFPDAHAVSVNPDGVGQVLLYPYYTTQRGQDTYYTLVNTTDIGKAVRVRFREAHNGRSVFEANVFLAPHDTWTAAIFNTDGANPNAGAGLVTTDKSCMLPTTTASSPRLSDGRAYLPFSSNGYTNPQDEGPTSLARTREGFVEAIEMGDVPDGSDLAEAIYVPVNGNPTCAGLAGIAGADLVAPTGGLDGQVGIIDVSQGTYFTTTATALDGFSERVLYADAADGEHSPTLASANTNAGPVFARTSINGSSVSVSYPANQAIDAVTAALAAVGVHNEFINEPSLGASTDWVITFPTKQFYVDPALTVTATQPFPFLFGSDDAHNHASPDGSGGSCVSALVDVRDRDGHGDPRGGVSPPYTPSLALCDEVSVVSFSTDIPGSGSSALGSSLATGFAPFISSGSATIALESDLYGTELLLRPSLEGLQVRGVPVIGFEASNYINSNAQPGLLSNYSGFFQHRLMRNCMGSHPACS